MYVWQINMINFILLDHSHCCFLCYKHKYRRVCALTLILMGVGYTWTPMSTSRMQRIVLLLRTDKKVSDVFNWKHALTLCSSCSLVDKYRLCVMCFYNMLTRLRQQFIKWCRTHSKILHYYTQELISNMWYWSWK